jgi:hypothetical protein
LPQVGGVVALQNSTLLTANLAATPVVCPAGHYQGTGVNAATNGACRSISYPRLENNIIYRNASYQIGVGSLSAQFQQNVITLYNAVFTGAGAHGTAAPSQAATGSCLIPTGGTTRRHGTEQPWFHVHAAPDCFAAVIRRCRVVRRWGLT